MAASWQCWARFRPSDAHFGEGAVLEDGRPNVREDFKDSAGYERMLGAILERYPIKRYPNLILALRWGGDMIDFNPIRRRAGFWVVPTEQAALEEFEICLRGHDREFENTARFLRDPRTRLEVEIGNHDLPLVWPSLQARLCERLLPEGERHRIRFIYGEELIGRVVYTHGDPFDPFNANPPEDKLFITSKTDRGPLAASLLTLLTGIVVARGVLIGIRDLTWWRLGIIFAAAFAAFLVLSEIFRKVAFWKNGPGHRVLNMPYGTYLDTFLVDVLKPHYPWYGRTVSDGHTLAERFDVFRNWRYVGLIILFGLPHALYHRFFRSRLDVRMKAGVFSSLRMLKTMTTPPNIMRSIWRMLRRYPQAKWVVMGHYHASTVWPMRRADREVIMIDTGTAIEQVRMGIAEVATRTTFLGIEAFFRRVLRHWRKHPRVAAVRTVFHLVVAGAAFALYATMDWKADVVCLMIAVASLATLLIRQSLTLEEKERFTRFTLTEECGFSDGSQRISLLRFDQHAPDGVDPFSRYLET